MNPTIQLLMFKTSSGKFPFFEWVEKLDREDKAIIKSRLDRVSFGILGDCKPIKNGKGVWEIRIKHGPGYRIYYGKIDNTMILLLGGGR